jgi:Tol biopolymer transport system component/DNA-binding winged helix-turn-helix (wHTH) protein
MSQSANRLYEFGVYRLDPAQKLLFRDGKPIPLTIKAVEVLETLLASRGRVVAKDEIMKAVWPNTFVEEGNLTFHIHALRKALGDHSDQHTYIETIPRRGYRIVPEVREIDEGQAGGESPQAHHGLRSGNPEAPGPAPIVPASRNAIVKQRLWIGVAGVAAFAIGIIFAGWRIAMRDSTASAAPFIITPFTSYPGVVQSPTFSPDGERIAFAWTGSPRKANWSIYVKLIGAEQPLKLTDAGGEDFAPAWSPDGRQIAFVREHESEKTVGIYAVSALGGRERKLIDLNYGRYFDLAWSPDGKSIVYAEKMNPQLAYDDLSSYVIKVLNVGTLEKRQLTFPAALTSDIRFAFSPDGETIAFLRHGYDPGVGIFTIPERGGAEKHIHSEPAPVGNLAWSSDGRSIVFTSEREGGSKFWRLNLDGDTPQRLPLAEEMAYDPAISRRGNRFAYVRQYFDSDLFRVDLSTTNGMSKSPVPFEATARVETCPAFSPDGTKLAFLSDRSGKREVWMSDSDGSNPVQLTDFYAWSTTAPSWSADSNELLFFAGHGPMGTRGGIFILSVKGKNIRRVDVDGTFVSPKWSRDGNWIYASTGTASDSQVWKIPPGGGSPIQVTLNGGSLPRESPDGRYIYYVKWPKGIWRIPVAGGKEEAVLPDFSAALMDHWQVMNDGVYFVNGETSPYATLEFYDFAGRKMRAIAELTGAPTTYNGGLTVSANRKEILYSQDSRSGSDIMLAENFR